MQSIRNKCDKFSDIVLQNDLALVAITETWFKPEGDLIIHECTPQGIFFIMFQE